MLKIALINMPFSALQLPSIGLTQLKSVVDKNYGEQVSVDIRYINLDFAKYLGLKAHNLIMNVLDLNNTGMRDWFFRQAFQTGCPGWRKLPAQPRAPSEEIP